MHVNIIMLHGDIHKSGVKATLAKILLSGKYCVWKFKILWYDYVILKQPPNILKYKNPLECSWNEVSIYICLQSKYICLLGEWVKIQYLWGMLKNIYCVLVENDSLKHVYSFYFSCRKVFERKKNTAYAIIT